MCTGVICGVSTIVTGAILVIASTIVGFVVVPNVVENSIIDEVVLRNDTIQFDRFQNVPFPLNFTVRIFNISNANEVMNGAAPVLNEIGPYRYKLHMQRNLEHLEDDLITYRILDRFEFDPVASFPHTEDDLVHIANVAYHGILQIAEARFPQLMPVLNTALNGIFGGDPQPIKQVRVGDLLFDGIKLCENPDVYGSVACALVRQLSGNVQNMDVQEDGIVRFSVLGYRNGNPAGLIEAYRGLFHPEDLGRITSYKERKYLEYWAGTKTSLCNRINGTDSGVFNPFIDKEKPLYALNSDICRSVELRYQYDTEYNGIPATRFTANEWFLDNDDGCFCLNLTKGITDERGCLYKGAMELFTCVGAYMILTYPHFLYADIRYRNGVLGLSPTPDLHRIYLDIEPNTGVVIRGAKRAQFNVFLRPVEGVPATQRLSTTLTPFLWVEESIELPEEYSDELTTKLLSVLNLLDILIPVVVALSCSVLVIGVAVAVWFRTRRPKDTTLTN